jgi:hypothetical protein
VGTAAAVHDDRRVWLIAERAPESDEEAAVQAMLADGALPLSELVEAVTTRLIAAELQRSAGSTDVGVWGGRLFPQAVLATIEALDGSVLRVDDAGRATRESDWAVSRGGRRPTAAATWATAAAESRG